MAEPVIYIITYHKFNHHLGRLPVDERFLAGSHNYVFFLIDDDSPRPLSGSRVLFEKQIDPELHVAGQRYLAEWSFLLSEARHGFCEYPFFVVSSRFYEKNTRLASDLNREWDTLFCFLSQYGWGYLPSYDRPWAWQDLRTYRKEGMLPVSQAGRGLISKLYGVDIPGEYTWMSDFFCNYIGFQSRDHLLAYVEFYMPLIKTLLDDNYVPKDDLAKYVSATGVYRNEKPFTFYLELLSHLFFFKNDLKFFGLHYDGYYQIDEKRTEACKLAELARDSLGENRAGFPAGYSASEHRLRLALAHRWSPYRLLFDGLFKNRLKNFLGNQVRQ